MKLFKSTGEKTQSYPYFNAVEAAQMGEKQKVETILSENFCILKDKSLTEECTTPFNFVDIGSETSCTVNIKQEIGDRFLNASTLDKLINLKYEYSLKAKSNSWKLPMEIWK